MTLECTRVQGINLAQGVCDLPVPEPVLKGAEEAVRKGYNTYTRYDGLELFREAIVEKYKHFYNTEYAVEGEIIVSNGATGGYYAVCMALLEPGDEVVLFEPFYGYHVSTLKVFGVEPKFVRPAEDDSFSDRDLEAAIGPKTKALVLNTPVNPSGKVFSEAEIRRIGEIAQKHDIYIITDEIYEHFLFDGNVHVHPASLPGLRERCFSISGLSKTFSITGWRIGWVICPPQVAQTVGYFNDLVYVCPTAPLQYASARGMRELGDDYYANMARSFQAKRDKFCAALADVGLTPKIPQGAYYALADLTCLPGETGKDKAMYLLEKTGLACVPGAAFFTDPKDHFLARFCFAKEDDILDQACERLQRITGC